MLTWLVQNYSNPWIDDRSGPHKNKIAIYYHSRISLVNLSHIDLLFVAMEFAGFSYQNI